MISILLVDDSNDKVVNILKAIREISDKIKVEIAIDFVSALDYLSTKQFDLLILDISLPIREGIEPNIETGQNLLKEIDRKSSLNSPYFIIGLTQYLEECKNFSDVWQTLEYSPESTKWKAPLTNLIRHILKCGLPKADQTLSKPTIFLEGKSDEKIITLAIKLFKPELTEKIVIKADKSAGASWVARQIIAWSHSLNQKDGEYVKAIGLLDGDYAAKQAQNEIKRIIKVNSVESGTFKIIKLNAGYAKHIIPIIKKGLELPITLEEMFEYQTWAYASSKNWLEPRLNAEDILTDPSKWNRFDTSLKDHLQTLKLSETEEVYLQRVKNEHKEDFVKYVLSTKEEDLKTILQCFEGLINDISNYLFPNTQS